MTRMMCCHSDNAAGLESQLEKNKLGQLNDDVRYSIKTKSFSQMEQQFGRREERLPEPQSKIEEKIYDITKVRMRIGSLSEIIHFCFYFLLLYCAIFRMDPATSQDQSQITRQ